MVEFAFFSCWLCGTACCTHRCFQYNLGDRKFARDKIDRESELLSESNN